MPPVMTAPVWFHASAADRAEDRSTRWQGSRSQANGRKLDPILRDWEPTGVAAARLVRET